MSNKKWTEEAIDYVVRWYPTSKTDDIRIALFRDFNIETSAQSITNLAGERGIKKTKKHINNLKKEYCDVNKKWDDIAKEKTKFYEKERKLMPKDFVDKLYKKAIRGNP